MFVINWINYRGVRCEKAFSQENALIAWLSHRLPYWDRDQRSSVVIRAASADITGRIMQDVNRLTMGAGFALV